MRPVVVVSIVVLLAVAGLPARAVVAAPPTSTADQNLPVLQRGDTGVRVRDLQMRLNAWITFRRHPLPLVPPTAIFAQRTEATVRAFQEALGLAATGIVDEQTWQRLPPARLAARPGPATHPCANRPEPINAQVRGSTCVARGTTVAFRLVGFQPGEELTFWMVGPDQSLVYEPESAFVPLDDPQLQWSTRDAQTSGTWTLIYQSDATFHTAVIPIRILPEPAAAAARAKCEPAYPTICIPLNADDLDCTAIPYRRFPVRRPDPHGLDEDGDGLAC